MSCKHKGVNKKYKKTATVPTRMVTKRKQTEINYSAFSPLVKDVIPNTIIYLLGLNSYIT